MWRIKSKAIGPDDLCIEKGTKLLCEIYKGYSRRDGEMRDEVNQSRWQFRRNKATFRSLLRHPLKRPDFVATEQDNKDEVVIRRGSLIPSVFNIIERGRTVGTIRMVSMLRNKYSISIDGGKTWTFRMPLFTILFFGESKEAAEIWVRVGPSERHWNILIRPGVVQRPLVAALAFIHNERYFRG